MTSRNLYAKQRNILYNVRVHTRTELYIKTDRILTELIKVLTRKPFQMIRKITNEFMSIL